MDELNEDNAVLTITVYKLEPECLTYKTRVVRAYEPEYLEQIHTVRGLLDALQEQAEGMNLNKWIATNREVRQKIAEEREAKDAPN